ncbi:transporter substrate-binding domain-containing protein [Rheinheimera sp. D18]|uniref:substrate-binding periplasmic protein n=1 Tax=Rheinheimera sp. D18 TaxID=2545632 RepID=UPI00104F29DD|nr:transporter substrate-binding domain-containing protein [Rheinheimera sp. D18]QBL10478.1 transporter substrate-binding domain-containing protein [Rheinheimera sp. D18]
MPLLKQFFISLLLLTSLLTGASAWAEELLPREDTAQPQLIWCLDHFSRFHNYEDTAEPYGLSVDLMRELASRAGFKLTFTPRTASARCLRLMAEGKVDLMSNLRYSPERNRIIHMLPYRQTVPESLFLRHNDKRIIESTEQLRHMSLVRIRSYLYSPDTMAYLQQHPRHVTDVDSIEAALELLLRGRVDAIISPTISTTDAINNISGYTYRFQKAPLDFSRGNSGYIHIGLSRNSQHVAMLDELRQHLNAMIKDGTVTRLYDTKLIQPLLTSTESPAP